MNESGQRDAAPSESALRDALALDRTRLSNERTFLAYIRTSLAFFAAGAALLHFFPLTSTQVMGWLLLGLGALTIIIGGWRFLEVRRTIRRMVASHARLADAQTETRRATESHGERFQ